jgi:hypothetical protein
LERRVSSADKETVSHPNHASAHDDVAAAVCGALAQAASHGKYRYPAAGDASWISGPADNDPKAAQVAFEAAKFARHVFAGRYSQYRRF